MLSAFAVPVGGAKVFPFQHAINVLAGVLLGPWWAAGSALVTATLRVSLGTGSLFAFPGSPFGAIAVGLAYRFLRRDEAAFFEPVGTVLIGATLAALLVSPFLGVPGGLIPLMTAFALSSIPGDPGLHSSKSPTKDRHVGLKRANRGASGVRHQQAPGRGRANGTQPGSGAAAGTCPSVSSTIAPKCLYQHLRPEA